MSRYGGVEAGGTKFVCAVGSGPDDLEVAEFPTTSPEETLGRAIAFFRGRELDGIGIGSFGPIDPNPDSSTYGYITTTPKAGWRNVDLAGNLRNELGVPVTFDTDVNAAAAAENRWGAARTLHTFLYVTVGTGLGGGAMVNGRLLHGRRHPEMGHIRIPHDRQADPYEGCCPFHGDCLEGLASGTAMARRWGIRAENLPPSHRAWELEADYLALAVANWTCLFSPQRIILGGGVMEHAGLIPRIQMKTAELLNGYLDLPELVLPELGRRAGVLGAIALAEGRSI